MSDIENTNSLEKYNISKRRITLSDFHNERFYQLPKFLFEKPFEKLSNDSKVLYALLKDRHNLSVLNNWINERGEIYLQFKRESMQEMLNLSKPTITKAVNELIKAGLIEEERLGLNKANRIYLNTVTVVIDGSKNSLPPEVKKIDHLEQNNFTSEGEKILPQEVNNIGSNITNNNLTDFSDTEFNQSINTSTDGLIDNKIHPIYKYSNLKLMFHFGLSGLDSKHPKYEFFNQIVDLIVDELNNSSDKVYLNKEKYVTKYEFENKILSLSTYHLEYVDDMVKSQTHKIINMRSYLLTALYNSNTTMNSFYDNLSNSTWPSE